MGEYERIWEAEYAELRAKIERLNEECRLSMVEIARLRAEIERLRGPVAEDRQRCIDYWGKRAEKAEADKAELLAALEKIIKLDRIEYGAGTWSYGGCAALARAAIAKMEGK